MCCLLLWLSCDCFRELFYPNFSLLLMPSHELSTICFYLFCLFLNLQRQAFAVSFPKSNTPPSPRYPFLALHIPWSLAPFPTFSSLLSRSNSFLPSFSLLSSQWVAFHCESLHLPSYGSGLIIFTLPPFPPLWPSTTAPSFLHLCYPSPFI